MTDADQDWYLLDRVGRSYGPYDRTLVERLAAQGELAADTPVWHPGLARWRRAERVLNLAPAPVVERPRAAPTVPASAPVARPKAPPAVKPAARPAPRSAEQAAAAPRRAPPAPRVARPAEAAVHVWQRAAAAAFDLLLLATALRALSATVLSDAPAWVTSRGGLLVLWALLDGWLMAQTGTTPGKALLAVTIRAKGGTRLDDRRAFLRSAVLPLCLFLVWRVGPSLGVLIVPLLAVSFFLLRSGRNLWWDQMVGGEASYGELSQGRRFLIGVAFAALLLTLAWLTRLLPEITQRFV